MIKDEEYYKNLDKRTQEYKRWKAEIDIMPHAKSEAELIDKHGNLPNGLGDTIDKITDKTGIKKVVKFLLGDDCGCEERKEKLNELFRYRKPLCLNEGEFDILHDILNRPLVKNMRELSVSEQKQLLIIRNRIFQTPKDPTSCNSCGAELVKDMRKVYETYI